MLRLGLVCDFAEEGWPSMDLVGNMLFAELQRSHSDTITADRIRPPFRSVFRQPAAALGFSKSSHTASNADRLWNRMVEYPRWLRKRVDHYDLFHILDHSYAHLALTLPPGRTVITCHDLDTFRCLFEPARDPRPLWFRAMAKRILMGLQSAQHVIFVSEAVRQEAGLRGLIPGSRSSVVYNGADGGADGGSAAGPQNLGADADRAADSLLGASDGELLLLSVGSTVARKRVDVLLKVFAGIAAVIPSVRLVHAGGPLTGPQLDLARRLGVSHSILELPFLDRAVLGAVYRRAALLLQTSDAEGFGLPVAEAMAHGCPVVASDLPALREVGGQAAFYCPVADVPRWIETVIQLLLKKRSQSDVWSDLCSRSINNARRFTWQENAGRVANVYHEVAARPAAKRELRELNRLPKADSSAADEVFTN